MKLNAATWERVARVSERGFRKMKGRAWRTFVFSVAQVRSVSSGLGSRREDGKGYGDG